MLRLVIVALLLVVSQASIMSIDLGSEFIKIAAIKGNSTIDVVFNEQSRRKTYNFIGFRGTDRVIGDDARNLAARFPANFFPMTSKLAGVPFNDPRTKYFTDSLHIPIDLVQNERRGTIDVKCFSNPDTQYSSDELLAMLIQYCRDTTHKDAGTKPNEAVITIPHTSDMWQRNALVQAAQMVGVRISSLMHSTTAAALQFGIQNRGFENNTVYIAVFDMGSVAAEVGIYKFRPTEAPKEGRMKLAVSLGTIETLAIESDETLGGRMFDSCIAEMLQEEFIAQGFPEVLSGKTLQQRKAVFSLMRAANKAREILSANQHTPLTVEGVAPDRDFHTTVTRQAFEARCDGLFKKVVSLVDKAIKSSGVDAKDLMNVEMMGGAGRMPRMLTDMAEYLGRAPDRTMNSDEANVFGGIYKAAQLSAHVRVKSFAINDYVADKVTFDISKPDGTGFGARRELFMKAPFGAKRSITVNRTDDFLIRVFVEAGGVEKLFSTVNISGVQAAATLLGAVEPLIAHPNNSFAIRVEAKLTHAGVVVVDEAEARFRFAYNKTKKVKVQANETIANVSSDKQTEANQTEAATMLNTTVMAMKRKVTPLVAETSISAPLPMDSEEIVAAKATMLAIDKLEALKRATATAKNDLESYIQWLKYDGVLGTDEVKELGVITAEEEESLRALAMASQEWLEDGEGQSEECTMEQFKAKTAELKKVANPFWVAYQELKNPKVEEVAPEAEVANETEDATKTSKKAKKDTKKETKKEAKKEAEPKKETKKAKATPKSSKSFKTKGTKDDKKAKSKSKSQDADEEL